MIPCITVRRSILLAGTTVAALLAPPAFAQQPPASAPPATPPAAAQPLPPGSPLIGRPDGNEAAAKLAPIASPPLPAPPTSCRPPSSSCRQASTLRSMPAVSPTPALYVSATRERCLSAPALATKSPPL